MLDAAFPPRCFACGRTGTGLCPACAAGLPRLGAPRCPRCQSLLAAGERCAPCHEYQPRFEAIAVPWLYRGAVRRALLALKFRGQRGPARGLASGMTGEVLPLLAPGDVLVPVPLHRTSQHQRGYNQAAVLAGEIAWTTGLPVTHALERTRATRRQASVADARERRSNLAGAFRARRSVAGRSIWLVDDICTSGATLTAAADVLLDAGAARVRCIVAARAADSAHSPQE